MLSAPLLLRNNLAPGLAAKKTALRRPVGAPLVVTRVAPPIAGQRDKDDQVQAISTGAGTRACNTPVLSGGAAHLSAECGVGLSVYGVSIRPLVGLQDPRLTRGAVTLTKCPDCAMCQTFSVPGRSCLLPASDPPH